jgi:hypothetical protein
VADGQVVWGAVPYTSYDPRGVTSHYVRGCVNVCVAQLQVCLAAANGTPAAVDCQEYVNRFGELKAPADIVPKPVATHPLPGCSLTEVCDGVDNNGDGRVDESDPLSPSFDNNGIGTTACTVPGLLGECAKGKWSCKTLSSAPPPFTKQMVCTQVISPSPETCDNLDNDCNGLTDDNVGSSGPCVYPNPGGVAINLTNCTKGPLNGGLACGECFNKAVWQCLPDPNNPGRNVSTCVPAAPSPETCDGKDNNCNSVVDDAPDQTGVTCDAPWQFYYKDKDKDGYYDQLAQPKCLCHDIKFRQLQYNTDATVATYTFDKSAAQGNYMKPDSCDECSDGSALSQAALVNPGVTTFYTVKNCCGNFDYNGDGQWEEQDTTVGSDSCHWNISDGCDDSNSTPGWDTFAPFCGQTGTYIESSCKHSYAGSAECEPNKDSYRTQGCR